MQELTDDQSHYEISLTAGQAFAAFVLLLLSLAASFAFGLMVGRGQADDRLVVRKEPAVVSEASVVPKKNPGKLVDLGVANDDFKPAPSVDTGSHIEAPAPTITETTAPTTSAPSGPVFAQLLSTSDQKIAEALAAKLIDNGFSAAYVERTASEKGTIFRVRIKFPTETEARAAEPKLKGFSKEVWITKQ